MLNRLIPVTLLLAACVLAACEAPASDDDFAAFANVDEKSDLFSLRMRVQGTLSFGEDPIAIDHTGAPRYVAMRIEGHAGDELAIEIGAQRGVAKAWLLDASFTILASASASAEGASLLLAATLPASGRHYLALRDGRDRPAAFVVSLRGRPAMLQCEQDHDCAAVPIANCCVMGQLTAVASSQVEAYADSWPDCRAVRCAPREVSDVRVARCGSARVCELIDPLCDAPGRDYRSREALGCEARRILCGAGMQPFSDRCGCGCEPR